LIKKLIAEGRAPRVILFENVSGLKERGGALDAVHGAFGAAGYGNMSVTIDAKHFVPQSRPRLFIIGALGIPSIRIRELIEPALKALPRRNVDLAERFTDGALPAGAFDRAVSDIDTFFQVELGAMQLWNITTEGLKDIRHPVLSMRGSDTLPVFFEVADLLQRWIPEIDTVSIPCASHDLPGRNPAAVATGLVEFFTKNDLDIRCRINGGSISTRPGGAIQRQAGRGAPVPARRAQRDARAGTGSAHARGRAADLTAVIEGTVSTNLG
jgi:pimeloyl-ACP methyl ester carboxylesterase